VGSNPTPAAHGAEGRWASNHIRACVDRGGGWGTRSVKPGPVQYAWNGDNALAYQVVGDGPIDLLVYFGHLSNLDVMWESPYLAGFLRGLAAHGRLIITDRRGWGCSERFSPADVPPMETLADDLAVVLDAAGSRRAVVLATMDSGMIAQFFAAIHADRTAGLILVDSFVSWVATQETPWMREPQAWEAFFARMHNDWGVRFLWGTRAVADEPRELEWYLRYQRSCAAPGALIAEQRRFLASSTAGVLDAIHVPTLVLNILFDDTARYLTSRIAGARLVTLEFEGQLWWYEPAERITEEVGKFLAEMGDEHALLDRVLATVLFRDIVDSTAQAAAMGDRRWRATRERHDALVRSHLARYRGREVKTMGDGFLATFDGPARAVRCAQAIVEGVGDLGIEVRAGLHTGEIELDDLTSRASPSPSAPG
jgi:pimeloyl-ACP methyl ester carboxylesterase